MDSEEMVGDRHKEFLGVLESMIIPENEVQPNQKSLLDKLEEITDYRAPY